MAEKERAYFKLLKQQIASMLMKSVPGVNPSIEEWKGQEIVYFQEDLQLKVKGSISEKWFYTHIKDESEKLPRIDVLNLLSKYAGYLDWNDFKVHHKIKEEDNLPGNPVKKDKRLYFIIAVSLIFILILYLSLKPKTYQFCFIDSDSKGLIKDQPIEIIVLNDDQSPEHYLCQQGCFTLKTRKDRIRFVVKTPYYRVDTISRNLSSPVEEIHLATNDYALMIHYFSKASKSDWVKRRKQLDLMIADNARIFQVYNEDGLGMELFNKQEFIDKLTMPVHSLNDIEVIETIYSENRISMLKFRQKPKSE